MSDAQASQMITPLTALLGGMERLVDQTEQIRLELAETGEQLAELMQPDRDELVDFATTAPRGRA